MQRAVNSLQTLADVQEELEKIGSIASAEAAYHVAALLAEALILAGDRASVGQVQGILSAFYRLTPPNQEGSDRAG